MQTVLEQLHAVLCRMMAQMRLYWPDDQDNGITIAASSELRLGPFTGGQVVTVFNAPETPGAGSGAVRIVASVDQRVQQLANQTAVPANAPTYQLGVHSYIIRPGPAKYLFFHNPDAANAIVVGVIRGDTDTSVHWGT